MTFNKETAMGFLIGFFTFSELLKGILFLDPYRIFHISIGVGFAILCGFIFGIGRKS